MNIASGHLPFKGTEGDLFTRYAEVRRRASPQNFLERLLLEKKTPNFFQKGFVHLFSNSVLLRGIRRGLVSFNSKLDHSGFTNYRDLFY